MLDNKSVVPDPMQLNDICPALLGAGPVLYRVWHAWDIVAMIIMYEDVELSHPTQGLAWGTPACSRSWCWFPEAQHSYMWTMSVFLTISCTVTIGGSYTEPLHSGTK